MACALVLGLAGLGQAEDPAGTFDLGAAPEVPEAPAAIESDTTGPTAYIFQKNDKILYYRDKVFVQGGQELEAPIIISFYGEDALSIVVAASATLSETEILLPAGYRYILDKNGAIVESSAFPTMNLGNTLGTELPGTFVEGRAFIEFNAVFPVLTIEENRYGIRTLTLARNKWKDPSPVGALHLYDGFQLSFKEDSSIDSQIAFQELSINGMLTKPEDRNYLPRTFGNPGAIPGLPNDPMGNQLEPGVCLDMSNVKVYCDSGLPVGRDVNTPNPEDEAEPVRAVYTRPAIRVIGIVPFKYFGKLGTEGERGGDPENYIRMMTENLEAKLKGIEGLEVKVLTLDPEDQVGGAFVLDFAKRIGQKYGCDAILHGQITILETISDNTERLTGEVRLNGEVKASITDTTGGRFNWSNSDKVRKFTSSDQFERASGPAIRDLLNGIAGHLVTDMQAKNVFAEQEVK